MALLNIVYSLWWTRTHIETCSTSEHLTRGRDLRYVPPFDATPFERSSESEHFREIGDGAEVPCAQVGVEDGGRLEHLARVRYSCHVPASDRRVAESWQKKGAIKVIRRAWWFHLYIPGYSNIF